MSLVLNIGLPIVYNPLHGHSGGAIVIDLDEVRVHHVERSEEVRHHELMATHHHLDFLPKIGRTLCYVATYQDQWVVLLNFSVAAWKCVVRDQWIGWDFHRQYDYNRLGCATNLWVGIDLPFFLAYYLNAVSTFRQ